MSEDQRERDRSRRNDRPSRFSDIGRDRSPDNKYRSEPKRLHVSNIPYEYRWTDLKDLFKEHVGDVAFVELFTDDAGKSKGSGIVEFLTVEACKKALQIMHRYELKGGRKMVLKEEPVVNNRNKTPNMRGPPSRRDDKDGWRMPDVSPDKYNTYGLSTQFLDSISVQPPLVKKVFVANLDYKVDAAKVKEVFKLAGKVRYVDLSLDKEGKSRGYAIVEYDHPVEAVQAISMFDKQQLYDRKMTVRMDRASDKPSEIRLPDGLKSIGLGLGANGEPLRDVSRNLPSLTSAAPSVAQPSNSVVPMASGLSQAVPAANVAINGLGTALGAGGLSAANSTLASTLGLQALGLTGLGALQNQLLQQGLTTNDLAGNLASALSQAQGLNLGGSGLASLGGNDLSGLNASGLAGNMLGASGGGGLSSLGGNGSGRNSLGDSGYGGRDIRDKHTILISNLPPSITWQLLREKFSECGDVKYTEMTSSDSALIRFGKEWDAERAVKMFDRTRIDGRTIDVRFY